ncbi:MAG: efflux RND transporter periplasmic adaptor subunit [Candidatus Latescibacteria bacterium]|nr:efflux RND transporter periplasmic adaptor subunit [Candidatus Latescibacterota bacterium]
MRWVLPILCVLGLTAGAVYYWGRSYGASPSAETAGLALVTPETRTLDATVSATGVVRLRVGAEVRVGAQLSGIVRQLNVTVGSHISKGEVIAEIESRGLEERIAQARAQVKLDEVALNKTQRDLERSQRLFATNLVSRQEIEDLATVVELAQAKLEKSRRDLAVVEADLAYTRIHAPISGTVASVSTQEGETVAASFTAPTFVTIIGDRALELVALVDETDIANVKPANPVTFTVEAYPSREFTGVVKRVAPKATIISGVVNYEVTIGIQDGIDLLKPDMTANVSIKTAQHETLVVPNAAVHRDEDERFVYVEREGKLEKRVVTVGIRDVGLTEIKKGVSPNDRVLVGNPSVVETKD